MKAGTETKAKYKRLKRRTGLPLWQVNGLLESLWQLTASSAPDGGLGRLSNYDIAASIEWDGDENEMIAMLAECGWIDAYDDPSIRFIVHDWSDHAPNYIRANFTRHGKAFLAPKEPSHDVAKQLLRSMPSSVLAHVAKDTTTKRSQAKPSEAQSSQANSSLPSGGAAVAADADGNSQKSKSPPQQPPRPQSDPPIVPPALATPAFLAAWQSLIATRRKIRCTVRPEWQSKWMEKLSAFGVEVAIDTVVASDENEWKGLFPDRYAKERSGVKRRTADVGAGKIHPDDYRSGDAF